jgi:hypothetical protein
MDAESVFHALSAHEAYAEAYRPPSSWHGTCENLVMVIVAACRASVPLLLRNVKPRLEVDVEQAMNKDRAHSDLEANKDVA